MAETEFKIDWCEAEAVRFACETWHYSKSVPSGRLVRFGVWEGGAFRGVVVFGSGASPWLARQYGLKRYEVAELVRVALDRHRTPVSRILSISVSLLRRWDPRLRLLVSFADPRVGHVGGIYQAAGWLYLGRSGETVMYFDPESGKFRHTRSVWAKKNLESLRRRRIALSPNEFAKVVCPGKHYYALPLDPALRPTFEEIAKAYPKKGGGTSPEVLREGGGSSTVERSASRREEAVRVRPRRSKSTRLPRTPRKAPERLSRGSSGGSS